MKLKVNRVKKEDGTLDRIEFSWRDAQFFMPGPGLDWIYEKFLMLGVMGLVVSFFYYAFAHKPDGLWWSGGIVGFALAVKLLERWQKSQKHVWRGLIFYADGKIKATKRLPELRRRTLKKADIRNLTGVEYGNTAQWTNMPSKYNLNVRGGWYDVFATTPQGFRVVFARNCWDRDANHNLALELGEAIREVQAALKTAPSNARVIREGPIVQTGGRRVID